MNECHGSAHYILKFKTISKYFGAIMIRINAVLHTILIASELQQFTVTYLKNQMITVEPSILPKESDQIVRRTLSKLLKIGFLEKVSTGKQLNFEKTLMFDATRLIPSKARPTKEKVPHPKNSEIESLHATLNQYQVDLLGFIGEAEEFKRLYEEFPNSKANLYPHYMNARNQGSTLMGKIKAVEAYLRHLKGASE